jgi:hypothetical protein
MEGPVKLMANPSRGGDAKLEISRDGRRLGRLDRSHRKRRPD